VFINHVAMIAVSDNENHCHCILFVQDASLNHIFMKVVYLHETNDILAVDKNRTGFNLSSLPPAPRYTCLLSPALKTFLLLCRPFNRLKFSSHHRQQGSLLSRAAQPSFSSSSPQSFVFPCLPPPFFSPSTFLHDKTRTTT
jgi:hypothetical protein